MAAKDTAALRWSPIAGAPFGIEVEIDSLNELGESQRQALRELYRRDGLLLIRGLGALSEQAQAEFCRIFGP